MLPMKTTTEFEDPDELVTFVVAGLRFQTLRGTLSRFPNTLLGDPQRLRPYWNAKTNEYFFDRNRASFESILYIYQSNGDAHRPKTVPIQLFLHEMKFYGVFDQSVMAKFWENEGFEKPDEVEWPANRWQRKVWAVVEYPQTSLLAKVFGFFSIAMIVVSIVSFVVETMPQFDTQDRQWKSPFFWIELVCNCWFLFEFVLRFISAPSKCDFLKKFLNLLDVCAIAPSTLSESTEAQSQNFAVLRVIRVVRVFKLTRHSLGLQVLIETFKASQQELMLMGFFLVIGLVLFSSAMHVRTLVVAINGHCRYFAENNEPDTAFDSIPGIFWFTLATITTCGFGDMASAQTKRERSPHVDLWRDHRRDVCDHRDCYRHANRMASLKRQRVFDETHARHEVVGTGCDLVRDCKLRDSLASSSSDED
ncbi:BTB domain-containing protein [Aphelenchoides fujianensis]|nr:BTB domain-containing protein [Aphelenchoides fujianensis]